MQLMTRHAPALLAMAALVTCGGRTDLGGYHSAPRPADADVDSSPPVDAGTDVVSFTPCTATKPTSLCQVQLPGELAVDANWVYFDDSEGNLRRVSKAGGLPTTIGAIQVSSVPVLTAFALDANNLYYQSQAANGLVRLPKGGGTETSYGVSVPTAAVSIDSSAIYVWSYDNATDLWRVALSGGPATPVTMALPNSVLQTLIDGTVAYVAGYMAGLFVVDLSTGTVTRLWMGTAQYMAMDATNLYVTTGDHGTSGTNNVVRVPKGGSPSAILATARYANGIVVDGSWVYYVDELDGTVVRVPTAGGSTQLIASLPGAFPLDVTVDEQCVYWTDSAGVYATPKPP